MSKEIEKFEQKIRDVANVLDWAQGEFFSKPEARKNEVLAKAAELGKLLENKFVESGLSTAEVIIVTQSISAAIVKSTVSSLKPELDKIEHLPTQGHA